MSNMSQIVTMSVSLPEDKVIVEKQYLLELIDKTVQQLEWRGLKEASEQSGIEKGKLAFILKTFRGRLDVEKGGCVLYPKQGGIFAIEPVKFQEFYRKHFDLIQRRWDERK